MALHSNIGFIDTPGIVGRLEMTPQPLFQFRTVTLNPTPDSRVIRRQTALGEQLFDIAQREPVAKIPPHRTQNQLWCRLPPLEDCRSNYVLHDLFTLPATPAKLATHPLHPPGLRASSENALHYRIMTPEQPICPADLLRNFLLDAHSKFPVPNTLMCCRTNISSLPLSRLRQRQQLANERSFTEA